MSLEIAKGWTHVPILVRALFHTTGPVLEFGAGYYSTAVLAELCRAMHRDLTTVEQDDFWADWAARFGHRVLRGPYPESRAILLAEDTHFGVILLDHDDQDRVEDGRLFATRAQVVLHHDSPGLATHAPFSSYRYHRCYELYDPKTSLLSNENDLAWAADCRGS